MRHTDKTVTVYQKRWDEENAVDVYRGTVLDGVSFFSRIATTVSTDGLTAACEAICRIPVDVFPEDLSLCNGDLICEGAHSVAPETVDDVPVNAFTIVGITRNASGKSPHVKVVCK